MNELAIREPEPPAAIEVRSNAADAAIRQGSRDLVRSHEGAVMAVWNADGTLEQTFVMQAADDFRVPIPSSSLVGLSAARRLDQSGAVSEDWTDVMSSATAQVATMLKLPAGSAVVMYLG